jgi:hypothetical protein
VEINQAKHRWGALGRGNNVIENMKVEMFKELKKVHDGWIRRCEGREKWEFKIDQGRIKQGVWGDG